MTCYFQYAIPNLFFCTHHLQLYTFLETILVCLALIPSFLRFFSGGGAKNHKLSPEGFSAVFLASGKYKQASCINLVTQTSFLFLRFRDYYCSLQIDCLDAVLNLAFALSLLCFVVMHISLLLSNTTSVEVSNQYNVFLFTLFVLVNGHAQCRQIVPQTKHIPVVMAWNHVCLFLNFYNRIIETWFGYL